MIKINLLPEELKTKKPAKAGKVGLELKKILYFMPLAFVILILLHLYLATTSIIKGREFTILNNKWQKLESEKKTQEKYECRCAKNCSYNSYRNF